MDWLEVQLTATATATLAKSNQLLPSMSTGKPSTISCVHHVNCDKFTAQLDNTNCMDTCRVPLSKSAPRQSRTRRYCSPALTISLSKSWKSPQSAARPLHGACTWHWTLLKGALEQKKTEKAAPLCRAHRFQAHDAGWWPIVLRRRGCWS